MDNYLFMLISFVLLVVMSGLFAGSETGMYQISRLRLRLGAEKKITSYVILSKCLHDGSGLLLAILIGNNLVNYLATSIATAFFLSRVGTAGSAEYYATAVTVPVLFVFGEVIPKNLFFFRADTLMPYVGPVLYVFHRVLNWCGIVPALKYISNLLTRLTGLLESSKSMITSVQRHKVQALIRETHEEGILSSVQSNILNRLVSISHVRLGGIMIPLHDVETVDVKSGKSDLLSKLKESTYTRLIAVEGQIENVVGFFSIYDILSLSEEHADLRDFIKPIRKLNAEMSVTEAIEIMRKEDLKIVLVARTVRGGKEKPVGIITMKDLVEELLGELAEW